MGDEPFTFSIERAAPSDWARVRDLRLRALGGDPDAFGSTLEDESRFPESRWRERAADPAMAFFIAVRGSADVGIARFAEHGGLAGLFSMWVAPACRGRGVGGALVERIAAEARARGHERLLLWVVDANAGAARLYERCGFAPTGRRATLPPPRAHITEHERVLHLGRAV